MRQPKPKAPHLSPPLSWAPAAFSHPLCGPVEALLFASDRPLPLDDLHRILSNAGHNVMPQQIEGAIRELEAMYAHNARGMKLVEVAGGWQFRSNPEYTELIRKLFQFRPPRLSKAALECISTIAYRQPVTRSEIDALRGVDSGGVLRSLLERRLIMVVGRHDSPGRPYLYGTSPEFLEFFGLNDLRELPSMAESLPPQAPITHKDKADDAQMEMPIDNPS